MVTNGTGQLRRSPPLYAQCQFDDAIPFFVLFVLISGVSNKQVALWCECSVLTIPFFHVYLSTCPYDGLVSAWICVMALVVYLFVRACVCVCFLV